MKKLFLPSPKNDYKPHIVRELSLAIFSFVAVLIFFVGILHVTVIQHTNLLGAVISRTLVELTNTSRSERQVPTLTPNTTLEYAAQLKANDMAQFGYFAHNSPQGKNPWYWFTRAGYDYVYAGENLAVNFSDSNEVGQAWMNSPAHRDNILNGKYTEIGIATAQGVYEGRPTTFVVQMFGRPMTQEQKSVLVQVNSALDQKSPTPVPIPNAQNGKKVKRVSQTNTATTSTTTIPVVSVKNRVLGSESFAEIENIPVLAVADNTSEFASNVTLVDTVLANPKQNLTTLYLAIAGFLFACLVLTVFVEIRKQHPYLVLLGVVVIALILVLLYLFRDVISTQVQII